MVTILSAHTQPCYFLKPECQSVGHKRRLREDPFDLPFSASEAATEVNKAQNKFWCGICIINLRKCFLPMLPNLELPLPFPPQQPPPQENLKLDIFICAWHLVMIKVHSLVLPAWHPNCQSHSPPSPLPLVCSVVLRLWLLLHSLRAACAVSFHICTSLPNLEEVRKYPYQEFLSDFHLGRVSYG